MSASAKVADATARVKNLASRFVVRATSVLSKIKSSKAVTWVLNKVSVIKATKPVQSAANLLNKVNIKAATTLNKLSGPAVAFLFGKLGQGIRNPLSIREQFRIAFGDWRNLPRRMVKWTWELLMVVAGVAYYTALFLAIKSILIAGAMFAVIDTVNWLFNRETVYSFVYFAMLRQVFWFIPEKIVNYKPEWLKRFYARAYTHHDTSMFYSAAAETIENIDLVRHAAKGLLNESDRKVVRAGMNALENEVHELCNSVTEIGMIVPKHWRQLDKVLGHVEDTLKDVQEAKVAAMKETTFSSDEVTDETAKEAEAPKPEHVSAQEIDFDNIEIAKRPQEMGADLRRQANALDDASRRKFRKNLARNLRRQAHTQQTVTLTIQGYDAEDAKTPVSV